MKSAEAKGTCAVYYSIMSVRLPRDEARAYCALWSKNHFLPRSRFSVIREGDHYRVICKVYARELYQYEFTRLQDRTRTLKQHTRKVKLWLKKLKKFRRGQND